MFDYELFTSRRSLPHDPLSVQRIPPTLAVRRGSLMRRRILALLCVSVIGAAPLAAQRQSESNAFTWSGRVPSGHWIRVRNLSGEITVTASNSDRVEVTAT